MPVSRAIKIDHLGVVRGRRASSLAAVILILSKLSRACRSKKSHARMKFSFCFLCGLSASLFVQGRRSLFAKIYFYVYASRCLGQHSNKVTGEMFLPSRSTCKLLSKTLFFLLSLSFYFVRAWFIFDSRDLVCVLNLKLCHL